MSTDKDWEKWGATDPYFGVLSSEEFRKDRLDPAKKEVFFASGSQHIERLLQLIGDNFNHIYSPHTALDFGCGVGRLTLALAKRTERTVGVDISPSMIAEASENAKLAGITNVSFALSDDALTQVSDEFNLVHSYLVLQHIPWSRGRMILQQLANRVEPGGYLAIHFFTSYQASKLIRAVVRLRYAFPPLHWLRNVLKRRPLFEPPMQLHIYNTDKIITDLKARNFDSLVYCNEPDMDGFQSIYLLAHRKLGVA